MLTYQGQVEVKWFVWAFIYIHTLCTRAGKVLASLRICADSPEPSQLADVKSTEISCKGPYWAKLVNMIIMTNMYILYWAMRQSNRNNHFKIYNKVIFTSWAIVIYINELSFSENYKHSYMKKITNRNEYVLMSESFTLNYLFTIYCPNDTAN